jgi:hypothetical protein
MIVDKRRHKDLKAVSISSFLGNLDKRLKLLPGSSILILEGLVIEAA